MNLYKVKINADEYVLLSESPSTVGNEILELYKETEVTSINITRICPNIKIGKSAFLAITEWTDHKELRPE